MQSKLSKNISEVSSKNGCLPRTGQEPLLVSTPGTCGQYSTRPSTRKSSRKIYPFGRRKYRIPSGRNIKKALSIEDINKIYNYRCDPENASEQKAKDFWLFSYFVNGINVADIVQLRYKDIHGKFIIFKRAKTENSLREKLSLSMPPSMRMYRE